MVKHNCDKEVELAEMKADIKYIRESIEKSNADNKANTEFRLKANGVVAVLTIAGGFLGGIAMWIITKIWK